MNYRSSERFHNVTRGEIIITCIAFVIWTTICIFINMSITNATTKSNEIYYKAIQINNDQKLFEYAMKTNAGNALVYGEVNPVDSVSGEILKQNYLAIKVHIDKYVEKVRYEDITDEDGNVIGQRAVHYEEWERYKTIENHANEINFLGKNFPYSKLDLSNYTKLELNTDTVKDGLEGNTRWNYFYPSGRLFARIGDYRYEYYVIPLKQNITVLANLGENTMYNVKSRDRTVDVHYNKTIDQVMKDRQQSKNGFNILFTVFWYIIFVALAYVFINSRNKWADC